MSHFAKLDENNLVSQVVILSEDQCHDADGNCDETIGIAHCKKTISSGTWLGCYKDGTRKNFPSVGYSYSSSDDAFIPPKPQESWVLDATTATWIAPIARPSRTEDEIAGGYDYEWNEDSQSWVLTKLYPEE